jgi:hypothetical protein
MNNIGGGAKNEKLNNDKLMKLQSLIPLSSQ